MARILAFAGSTRRESLNKKLVKAAAERVESAGVEVTVIDLRDYPLPLYDGDLEEEEGLPENALLLKELMKDHQGFLISSPEYNSSISAVLKNTIDWASRPMQGESSLEAFRGKVAGLLSASPGAFGGLRGLVTVRSILGNIGVHVIPTQVSVGKAYEAFAEDGSLQDEGLEKRLTGMAKEFANCVTKLHDSTPPKTG